MTTSRPMNRCIKRQAASCEHFMTAFDMADTPYKNQSIIACADNIVSANGNDEACSAEKIGPESQGYNQNE